MVHDVLGTPTGSATHRALSSLEVEGLRETSAAREPAPTAFPPGNSTAATHHGRVVTSVHASNRLMESTHDVT
jgi:hypothetical protein